MSKQTRRLGRGLDSLVSDYRGEPAGPPQPPALTPQPPPDPTAAQAASRHPLSAASERPSGPKFTFHVPVETLEANPFQPRRAISSENVLPLARSILENGMLQPIVVRPHGRGYQIVAGERRWRAAREAGLTTVPILVREADDRQMLEWALIENIEREDLNAMDRAAAYREYCTRFGAGPEDLARRLGEDRTTVVNYLRLLDLGESIQALVASGRLSMGHARCLLGVGSEQRRVELAAAAVAHDLSVRALEEIVRRERGEVGGDAARPAAPAPARATPHVSEVQRRLEAAVKTKVVVREGRRKGTGRIVIEYYSLDDFDRIAGLLGVAFDE
ncbi:MAG TPA: ParB/RepB/Spo0J family partition protein [Phycisphaerae bacterium]|nr:ParB/RepB/Spo0J family partition protein [Phycisphaerae bacterium]HNU45651.1 ParB/RepB/Spo0J family partition protein [Phycisphaerae bacterium]